MSTPHWLYRCCRQFVYSSVSIEEVDKKKRQQEFRSKVVNPNELINRILHWSRKKLIGPWRIDLFLIHPSPFINLSLSRIRFLPNPSLTNSDFHEKEKKAINPGLIPLYKIFFFWLSRPDPQVDEWYKITGLFRFYTKDIFCFSFR